MIDTKSWSERYDKQLVVNNYLAKGCLKTRFRTSPWGIKAEALTPYRV